MSPVLNAWLGILFLVVGIAATFLMFHIWSYPYDQEKQEGTAPKSLLNTHRMLGVVYLAIYIYFMIQMVPRLWNYQVEFPARTVAHLVLGMTIGAILFIKIAIVRYFRHVGKILVPVLGTSLLICTFLLIGLSAPFAMRGAYLQSNSVATMLEDPESAKRVEKLLGNVSFGGDVTPAALTSPQSLRVGEHVLFSNCVQCHDLRTVLARPRTPQNWWSTVQRMAGRASLIDPLTIQQQQRVTAYLVAISPQLHESRSQQLQQEATRSESVDSVEQAVASEEPEESAFDPDVAEELFETNCSQCHALPPTDDSSFQGEGAVREVVQRMVEEGLDASETELSQIIRYLERESAKASQE